MAPAAGSDSTSGSEAATGGLSHATVALAAERAEAPRPLCPPLARLWLRPAADESS